MKTLTHLLTLLVLWLGLAFSASAQEPKLCTDVFPGINLAGAGFSSNKIPGRIGYDYRFPNSIHLLYYKAKGFKSVRLSVLWERLQPELKGDLDPRYLFEIQAFLAKAEQAGMCVLLDLHNYGRYRSQIIGTPAVPKDAFYDIWKKLAEALHEFPALYAYGLMNEPHDTRGHWHPMAQVGVDAIRSVDKKRVIYVPGEYWSSAWKWPKVNPAPFVTDPQNKIVYEAHIYFDSNSSGTYHNPDEILKPGGVAQRVMPFVHWLKKYGLKGAIGEWGVPTKDPKWFPVVEEFLTLAKENDLDWYIWSGGTWPGHYFMSLEPIDGKDRPLTEFISKKIRQGH